MTASLKPLRSMLSSALVLTFALLAIFATLMVATPAQARPVSTEAPTDAASITSMLGLSQTVAVGARTSAFGAIVRDSAGAPVVGADVVFLVASANRAGQLVIDPNNNPWSAEEAAFTTGATSVTARTNAGGVAVAPPLVTSLEGNVIVLAKLAAEPSSHWQSYTFGASITIEPAVAIAATLDVTQQLVAGRYVLELTFTNGAEPVDSVRLATRYGAKTFTGLAAGQTVTAEIRTFVKKLPPGEASAVVVIGGTPSVLTKEYPGAQ